MINGKKIGLVLSGGGAKGLAHVGAIKVLEANGIIPDIIVGTSMGSTVGGLYACGMPISKIESEFLKFKITDLFDLNVFNITKQGLIAGKKFIKLIDKHSKNAMIEDAKIKYACVACDLKTGKPYIFDKGKLSVATRTSSSIPGIFAPLKKDDMLLVDGGVINNIPTDVAYQMGADYVISVDCIGKAYLIKDIKSVVDILMSSFSLTQYHMVKCKGYRSDAKIVVNNYEHDYYDAKKESFIETIQLGEAATNKKIAKIKRDLQIAQ